MQRLISNLKALLFAVVLFAAIPVTGQQVFRTTTSSVIPYYEYVPKDYGANSNKYPVVIFLHGAGEKCPNTTDKNILDDYIWMVAKNGPAKHVKLGAQFPFILISPQLKNNNGTWPSSYIMEVINHVKTYLRIDERRIYITGFSMGGGGTWVAIQDQPKVFAAAAPICGGYNSPSKAGLIAAENLPVWAFHGDADTVVPVSRSVNMVNAINSYSPTPNPKALMTIYPGVKHNSWDRAYTLDHTYHTPNLYEWMMSKTNLKTGANVIPVANAGADVAVTGSTAALTATASDADGSISSYKWTKISGGNATMTNATTSRLSLGGLAAGTYMFKVQATDNGGLTDSDYIKVTVGSGTTTTTTTTVSNILPVANAGADVTITLPVNSVVITGSASDQDGSISSYTWTKISGGAASLSGTSTNKLTAGGLVEGTYVFRLTVKDNTGASAYDDLTVKVLSATTTTTTTNVAPVANAGSNITLTLPKNATYIYGNATDSDGTIASYKWTKLQGGSATLSGTTTKTLSVSGLAAGWYVFRLTVTDDRGATDYDDVGIKVQ